MNFNNPKLRDMLASEYALGTLHGPARRRFERLLRDDADLRRTVQDWEERLMPLTQAIAPAVPSKRVWRNIETRIGKRRDTASFWQNLTFWRALGIASTSLAFGLLVYFGMAPKEEAAPSYVAVLADKQSQPIMVVNFDQRARTLRVSVVNSQSIGADRSFELWSLPKGGAPRSLGLIPESGKAVMTLAIEPARSLPGVPALAVSLEPKGGSPTGAPTGPVLFTGPLLRL
jgi:anti-sigma-K factor RskA